MKMLVALLLLGVVVGTVGEC